MKLYDDLAPWYPWFTPLAHYAEEAGVYRDALRSALGPGRHRLLELGAGAGHNAHYLADDFDLTLTDLSPAMLTHARRVCPGAEIVAGDMRTLRLGRTFDAVFVHDALCYMLTEDDLRAVFRTARAHLNPGGVLLLAPDYFSETFAPGSDEGGSDEGDRAVRFLEWAWQPAGVRDRYIVDYAIFTREGDAAPVLHHDRHEEGLFSRAQWANGLAAEGFAADMRAWRHSEVEHELPLILASVVPGSR